jgi:hypothetical protein
VTSCLETHRGTQKGNKEDRELSETLSTKEEITSWWLSWKTLSSPSACLWWWWWSSCSFLSYDESSLYLTYSAVGRFLSLFCFYSKTSGLDVFLDSRQQAPSQFERLFTWKETSPKTNLVSNEEEWKVERNGGNKLGWNLAWLKI